MPIQRNKDFVGCENILEIIGERLSRSGSGCQVAALLGIGGVGYVMIDLNFEISNDKQENGNRD